MADPAEETTMIRSRTLIVVLGLALAPACVVRARGRVETSGGVAYQEPPAPRVETHDSSRSGYIWVGGRWNWSGGQWVWLDGHWETQRAGYAWTEGRWERRGNQWHWIEGEWATSGVSTTATADVRDHRQHDEVPGPDVRDHRDNAPPADNGMYPMQPPPSPRSETQGNAPGSGYIWVTGHWDWKDRNWAWLDGHWERQRARKTWVAGRWELNGGHYVWVEGGWN